jgi:uncharacterized integral membrane protein
VIFQRFTGTTQQNAITWGKFKFFNTANRVVLVTNKRGAGQVNWPVTHVIALLFLIVFTVEATVSVKLSHLG